MAKIACIFNYPPHYREPIYRLMDRELGCDFYFGDSLDTDIKKMDYEALNGYRKTLKRKKIGTFYRLAGMSRLAFSKEYGTFVATGEPKNLSSWLLMLWARLLGKRVMLWAHGWSDSRSWAHNLLNKAYFSLAHKVALYGNRSRDFMIAHGFSPEKLVAIGNSLDYDRHLAIRAALKPSDIYRRHFGNELPTAVYLGRLNSWKRLDLLVEAAAMLRDRGCPINVAIVGDGPDREAIESLAKRLGVPAWMPGACYDEEKNAELLSNADVCVSPGPAGLTAIHAMTYGVPVITNDDADTQMPEAEAVRPGSTGALFSANDAGALADAIERWLKTADREAARQACYAEIDAKWNPKRQLERLKEALGR